MYGYHLGMDSCVEAANVERRWTYRLWPFVFKRSHCHDPQVVHHGSCCWQACQPSEETCKVVNVALHGYACVESTVMRKGGMAYLT
jgi:hypothetical protein